MQGTFYISLDPVTGFAAYTIGEGLNGGYFQKFLDSLRGLLIPTAEASLGSHVTAVISAPANAITYGAKFIVNIFYKLWDSASNLITQWSEEREINTMEVGIGTTTIQANFGSVENEKLTIISGSSPSQVECSTSLENKTIPATSGKIAEEMHLPLWIDKESGIFKQRLNGGIQYNLQDGMETHPTAPNFFTELKTPAMTTENINNPWLDPKTGRYWNISTTYGAFGKAAKSTDHEKYYVNMRWTYTVNDKEWYFGKKIWIKNSSNKKAIVVGILDFGPAVSTGRVAGASPEVMKAIGVKNDAMLEYCWAIDQNIPYGYTLNY